eukprot:1143406-Pelagomonas_calceolata.AAC.1
MLLCTPCSFYLSRAFSPTLCFAEASLSELKDAQCQVLIIVATAIFLEPMIAFVLRGKREVYNRLARNLLV